MAKETTSKTRTPKVNASNMKAGLKVATKAVSKAAAKVAAGAAMNKLTKPRNGAAKRAAPVPAKKVAAKVAKPAAKPGITTDGLAHRTVKNIKQLRAVFDEFPKAVKFSTSALVGDTIKLLNVRGKPIAEVTLVK